MELIDFLIKKKCLKSSNIIEAFLKIKREDFVPEGFSHFAQNNEPLPIGHKQTISQPEVVAFMLEKLDPQKGEKILDIGAGSGWTSALLAELVGEKGKVIALELISELAEFGKNNLAKYDFTSRVDFLCKNGSQGYFAESPYNKILVSASAEKINQAWKDQLKTKGRIVASVKNSIVVVEKIKEDKFKEKEFYGFSFVPLLKE